MPVTSILPENPEIPPKSRSSVERDFENFARRGLPDRLEQHLVEAYGLDVSSRYAGLPIKNPWGKASGQLSMTERQVAEDAAAGLGFCVLKTVVAQDARGAQSMAAWAVPATRMRLERVRGRRGVEGWTVSWKGRGWSGTLEEYLSLVRAARRIGDAAGMLVVPSCKYHLPTPAETAWRNDEYEFTTRKLIEAYCKSGGPAAMPLEKDFSPTLAGSPRAAEKRKILEWLLTVPRLVRLAANGLQRVRVALKLFNALFEDRFQLEMLRALDALGAERPDGVVYANRLFDPRRDFEGHRGIAYGGPDLSDRNLGVLAAFQAARPAGDSPGLELSGTGNIGSGKTAVEYLLRGCSSFQLHTFFQLPAREYRMRQGPKTAKALHLLYFDPRNGLVPWLLHVAGRLGLARAAPVVRLADLVGAGRRLE